MVANNLVSQVTGDIDPIDNDPVSTFSRGLRIREGLIPIRLKLLIYIVGAIRNRNGQCITTIICCGSKNILFKIRTITINIKDNRPISKKFLSWSGRSINNPISIAIMPLEAFKTKCKFLIGIADAWEAIGDTSRLDLDRDGSICNSRHFTRNPCVVIAREGSCLLITFGNEFTHDVRRVHPQTSSQIGKDIRTIHRICRHPPLTFTGIPNSVEDSCICPI